MAYIIKAARTRPPCLVFYDGAAPSRASSTSGEMDEVILLLSET